MTDQPGYQPPSFDKPSGSSAVPPPSAPGGGGYAPPPADPGGYAPPAGGSYAAPPAYGAAPAVPPSGYGAPQGYGQPGGFGGGELVAWPGRAQSFVIDYFGPAVLAGALNFFAPKIGWLFVLAAVVWGFYNAYLGGKTGQSTGRKIAGTKLISEQTGAPIGGGLGIGRFIVHIVDAIPCYVGFLAPLWTAKKQTFTDMILKTIVVKV